ncbi:MAG TPA: CARDB domain-containing protein [Chthoniobacterales bacterium]|nr:CARDB domain-containing protein [Chthoniobacterales bacterium]
MKIQFSLFLTAITLLIAPLPARAITPATPDLVIEKTTQTSSTFWMVKVRNMGKIDAAATTLKMVATPGGSYTCPVPAIKAGATADVPCRMPFKSRAGMQCEFILNPDKVVAENNYGNNRTTALTNPKFN